MNKSESIAKLAEALSKAQGAMKNAIKDSNNPYFKSKYADLASVSDVCRPELAANGLSIIQLPTMRDGKMVLTYMLLHSSGEYITEELEMTPVKSDPQGIGSAITYARRYSLAAITGVATEDDDGNAASGNAQASTGNAVKNVARTAEDIPISKPNGKNKEPEAELKREMPPEETLISSEDAAKLHRRFRESLREELKPQADALLYDWLGKKLYLDANGNPSAGAIRKEEFTAIGRAAVKHAQEL